MYLFDRVLFKRFSARTIKVRVQCDIKVSSYNYPMLFVNKSALVMNLVGSININKQEQRALYLSFHYNRAALAIQSIGF